MSEEITLKFYHKVKNGKWGKWIKQETVKSFLFTFGKLDLVMFVGAFDSN